MGDPKIGGASQSIELAKAAKQAAQAAKIAGHDGGPKHEIKDPKAGEDGGKKPELEGHYNDQAIETGKAGQLKRGPDFEQQLTPFPDKPYTQPKDAPAEGSDPKALTLEPGSLREALDRKPRGCWDPKPEPAFPKIPAIKEPDMVEGKDVFGKGPELSVERNEDGSMSVTGFKPGDPPPADEAIRAAFPDAKSIEPMGSNHTRPFDTYGFVVDGKPYTVQFLFGGIVPSDTMSITPGKPDVPLENDSKSLSRAK